MNPDMNPEVRQFTNWLADHPGQIVGMQLNCDNFGGRSVQLEALIGPMEDPFNYCSNKQKPQTTNKTLLLLEDI